MLVELTAAGKKRMAELLPDKTQPWRDLGVSILHELIVPHLLGLADLPTPKYVRAIDEVVEGINAGDAAGRDATRPGRNGRPI